VWRTQAHVKPRTLYAITEASSSLNFSVNNADITTLECALLERMYYCKVKGQVCEPPPVTTGYCFSTLNDFKVQLLRKVGRAAAVSLEQVVEMYHGRKRSIYQNALERYYNEGWKERYAWLKAFVKMEKVNPTKAPRCIQPRDPVYNLRVGAYIKPLEHKIYKAIDKIFGDGPTVIKGYNVQQVARIMRGKWRSFARPVAIGLDAVKFDMHVSAALLTWEHSIYNAIYKCSELAKLLKRQIHQRGGARCKDGHLSYKVTGRRASGDMNTALGNCMDMCAMVYTYAASKGVSIKLMNNGDDCVVFMEQDQLDKFQSGLADWFLTMGFRMTCETPVYNLAEIEFCQMHPIEFGDGDIVMVRNIPVALRKDSLITVDVSTKRALLAWMTAVGEGGLALTGGIPIMQSYYKRLVQLGGGIKSKVGVELARNSGFHLLGKGVNLPYQQPTALARLSVFQAWGITPDEQIVLEEHFAEYSVLDAQPEAVDRHENTTTFLNTLLR
jgi:hypothetical protein